MGCGCGSSTNKSSNTTYTYNQSARVNVSPEGCDITKEDLNRWLKILQCIKSEGKHAAAGFAEFNVNQLLGTIQSALNYPENYCMYKVQLDYFKNIALIKIVDNVSECIN